MEADPKEQQKSEEQVGAAATLERDRASFTESLTEMEIPDDWEPLPVDPNYANPLVRYHRKRINGYDHVANNFFLAQGYEKHLAGYRARPSDIIVASFPKSGTTWLQELVWRVVHGETGASSGDATLEYSFPQLEQSHIMAVRPLEDVPEPRLIKSHLPYQLLPESVLSSGAKVLYVSRDARDACVSGYHWSRMVNLYVYRGTFPEFRERFTRGLLFPGPYKEHVKGYLDHADTVLCLTYEQLHSDRAEAVRKIAAFLGRALTDADVEGIVANTGFAAMKANPNTNFHQWHEKGFARKDQEEGGQLRKGVVGDWRNYFTEAESDAFMKWRNEPV